MSNIRRPTQRCGKQATPTEFQSSTSSPIGNLNYHLSRGMDVTQGGPGSWATVGHRTEPTHSVELLAMAKDAGLNEYYNLKYKFYCTRLHL